MDNKVWDLTALKNARWLGKVKRKMTLMNRTKKHAQVSGLKQICSPRIAAVSVFFLFYGIAAQAALPIQHWQTEKGANVYFVENHDLPLLDVNVDFAAGSNRDTASQSGLANLVLHMMDLGAAGLSDDDISRTTADVGAEMGGTLIWTAPAFRCER